MPTDNFGRRITYLRLSVTDRCNLRCIYCSQNEAFSWLPPEEVLSYEELLEVIQAAVALGFERFRITGGEPLLRRGLVSFIRQVAALEGVRDLALTTNGTLLAPMAQDLKKAGLKRLNISLDTLKPERFMEITGHPYLDRVLEGIEESLAVGLSPVKINVVVMRGVNDDELLDLARLSFERPVEVRFIEFMPVGSGALWNEERFVPMEEIRRGLLKLGKLQPVSSCGGGPAVNFSFPGARGKIGFISAMSHHFCARCNRLRLTPDGRLRPCLFSDRELDLKAVLRAPHRFEEIKEVLEQAVRAKPLNRLQSVPKRLMRSIGG